MINDVGPRNGQGSRLAVAAILIALLMAVMTIVGPLLSPAAPGESKLPPLFQVLTAR